MHICAFIYEHFLYNKLTFILVNIYIYTLLCTHTHTRTHFLANTKTDGAYH